MVQCAYVLYLWRIVLGKFRKLIGVMVSDVSDPYARRAIRGIIRQAKEYDYNVAVFSSFIKIEGSTKHKTGEWNIFNLPNYDHLDGVILLPYGMQPHGIAYEILDRIKRDCKCPVVSSYYIDESIPYMPLDEKQDFKSMVEHFIVKHKFTRINCLTGIKGIWQSEVRLEGYKEALAEHGIPIEEERMRYGDFWRQSGIDMVKEMLASSLPLPEAIVCANDYMAITVCDALKEAGIRVPEDICVSGYDNVREANLNTPSITTLMPPVERNGESCVTYLHERIEGKPERELPVLYGDIIFSESCGCKIDNAYDKNVLITQKNYQYTVDNIQREFALMNLMREDMNGRSNVEEFLEAAKSHTYLLKNYKALYLCLCDNWESVGEGEGNYLKEGYTKTMRLALSHVDGEYNSKAEEFPVSQMLPDLWKEHETMQIFFFVPIHFKDRSFGYGAFSFGDQIKIIDYNYDAWVNNLNNGLELIRVQNNLKWFYNKMDQIAIRDALTDVFNRRGLERYITPTFLECIKNKTPFILLVGDLDNLKKINDAFGHVEGDRAIQTITDAFRSIAAEDDVVLARTGGDEFVLAFKKEYSYEKVVEFKESVYQYIDKFNRENMYPYRVGVSIGIYYGIPDEDTSISDCHSMADHDMYDEKTRRKQEMYNV